jgi:hypothetical protein
MYRTVNLTSLVEYIQPEIQFKRPNFDQKSDGLKFI